MDSAVGLSEDVGEIHVLNCVTHLEPTTTKMASAIAALFGYPKMPKITKQDKAILECVPLWNPWVVV